MPFHMADTATPSGTPPASSAVPAAAPAPASSSTVPKTDINSAVQGARTPAELRALATQLRENPKLMFDPKAPKPAAPAADPAPAVEATPAAEPAPETPPAEPEATQEGEQPAAEPSPETPEGADPEEDGDDGEGPVSPLSGKRAHLRLNEADEVGRLALAYQRRNKDWSLEQSLDAARKQLGINPVEAKAQPKEDPATAALPKTVQDVDTLTSQLLAEYKKAMSEVRFEDAADTQAKLMQLTQHRSNLERSAERQEAQAAAKYDSDFDQAAAQAVDLYPFAADTKSPAGKRMAQIEADLKRLNDPLYYSPQKPLKIAQMVAAELNIAPRNKNAAPAKPAAVPTAPAPKKGMVPTGGSRSTPPPANTKPVIDQKISAVRNVHELRQVLRSVGVNSA